MCDYGFGPRETSFQDMIDSVGLGMAALPGDLYHLLVSPIGSFLDVWEVPLAARIGILELMAKTSIETFAFETRVETITDDAIAQCRSHLGNRGLKVYFGLESSNPWVARYCMNKMISLEVCENAIQTLTRQEVIASANVLLGAPFLTQLEAITNVLESVGWAFAKGADECNLFPIHVKQGTLLHWLYERDLYLPPSLWSLIEALRLLGEEVVCGKIKFSWYKPYGSVNVISSPTTCSICESDVVSYLDRFYETNEYGWIEKLTTFECSCKDLWREEIGLQPSSSILERAIGAYELIGSQLVKGYPAMEVLRERMREDAAALAGTAPAPELPTI